MIPRAKTERYEAIRLIHGISAAEMGRALMQIFSRDFPSAMPSLFSPSHASLTLGRFRFREPLFLFSIYRFRQHFHDDAFVAFDATPYSQARHYFTALKQRFFGLA